MARKNKGTFGKGKPKVEETDEFVSGVNKVLMTLRPHAIPLAIVGGLVTVGLVGWTGYRWYGERKEKRATDAYAKAVAVSRAQVLDPEQPPAMETPGPGEQTFPSEKDRRTAALGALQKVSADHGSQGAATMAELARARLLLEDGQFDSAVAAYRAVAGSGVPPGVRRIALEGVGYALEAKALANEDPGQRQSGLGEAQKAFAAIQPDPAQPGHDLALYHQARIQTALGQSDEALKTFKQILVDHADSNLADDINNRIAMIERETASP